MLATIGRSSASTTCSSQIPADGPARPAARRSPTASPRWSSSPTCVRSPRRNRHADELVCFAGGGAYDHYVPSVVWALAGRSEFYTSYTPVPARALPGRAPGAVRVPVDDLRADRARGLERLALRRRDGARRGRQHGASAGREAGCWCPRASIPGSSRHCRTYGRGAGYEPEVVRRAGAAVVTSSDVAAVVVQHPNVYGMLEPARELFAAAHDGGARAIQVFDPLSLGVLAPPGELGADIAVAEGQAPRQPPELRRARTSASSPRGSTTSAGCPGRIVGETVDVDGTTGYVLTLQAREQHIRREKANSQHLHEPDADGDRGDRLPRLARAGTGSPSSDASARRRPRTRRERSRRFPACRAAVPGRAVLQGVRRCGCRGRPRRCCDALVEHGFLAGVPHAAGGTGRVDRRRHRAAVARGDRRVRRGAWGRCWRRDRGRPDPDARARPPADGHDHGPLACPGAARSASRRSTCPTVDAPRRAPARRPSPDCPRWPRSTWSATTRGCRSMNYGVDTGFYPLGSCTMKYNPKVAETVAALPGFQRTASAAARRHGAGRARDALAPGAGALRDHRDGARHPAAARRARAAR